MSYHSLSILNLIGMSEINKILFATDFSERTENALIYVLNVASKLSAQIICFHSFEDITNEAKFILKKKEASETMRRMINSVSGINPKIKFDSVIFSGNFIDHIESVVKNNSIDLVVIGSKDAGWFGPVFTERKTGIVVEISPSPVLLIPEHFQFKPITNIVFLSNYYDSDIDDIVYLESLAKPFGATINIVNIEQEKNVICKEVTLKFENDLKIKLKNSKVQFHCIEGTDVGEVINNYSKENKIDLISMSTKHRNDLEKIYDPSFTETIAFNTEIPLLTFHIKRGYRPTDFI